MTVGDTVLAIARSLIGCRYVFGGEGPCDPQHGWDCSGLTKYCWYKATNGQINLAHHAYTQFHSVKRVCTGTCFEQGTAGDIVFFAVGNDCPPYCPGHCAICVGDGQHAVSATNPSTSVEVIRVDDNPYWRNAVMGIGRPAGPGGGGGGGNCGHAGVVLAADQCINVHNFTRSQAITSVAIAGAESGWVVGAENPPCCFGPWQINILNHNYTKQYVETWIGAAVAMAAISNNGHDWTPWSTFNSGAYRAYIDQATVAVDCIISNGGPGGGGGGKGVSFPLPLSRTFDENHLKRNLRTIQAWSIQVAEMVKGQPLDLAPHLAFEPSPYRFALRNIQDFVDSIADQVSTERIRLTPGFDETYWRRNAHALTDFASRAGATPPPPPGGGGGGGGGGDGPVFGTDRMANQTVRHDKDFAILRKTYGLTNGSDSWAQSNFDAQNNAGKDTMWYHFGRGPGHGGGTGAQEADFFIARVEDIVGAGQAGKYGLAYDWEPYQGYSPPQANVVDFIQRVQSRGYKIGLYTFWFFQPGGYPYHLGQDWFWVSYVVHPNRKPPGAYDIWQYDVIFDQGGDQDRSELSMTQLRARIHH